MEHFDFGVLPTSIRALAQELPDGLWCHVIDTIDAKLVPLLQGLEVENRDPQAVEGPLAELRGDLLDEAVHLLGSLEGVVAEGEVGDDDFVDSGVDVGLHGLFDLVV